MMSAQVQELIAKASGGDGQQASLTKIAALEKKVTLDATISVFFNHDRLGLFGHKVLFD